MAITQEKQSTSSSQASGQTAPGQQNLPSKSEHGNLSRGESREAWFPSPGEFFANPFAVMRRMHEDMDRMFAHSFGGGMMGGSGAGNAGGSLANWSPAIEVKQEKDNLVVIAELPGLKPDEVHVEVDEDALVIQGERKNEHTSETGGVQRSERRYGRFYRAIPLPEGAKGEQAKAEFRNGVLEVTIPVPEQQSHRRQIPIKS